MSSLPVVMTLNSLAISCANYPQLLDLKCGAVIVAICTLRLGIRVLLLCTVDHDLDWDCWSQWENFQLPNSFIREFIPATKSMIDSSKIVLSVLVQIIPLTPPPSKHTCGGSHTGKSR